MFTVFNTRRRWPKNRFGTGDLYQVWTLYLFGCIPLFRVWRQLTTRDPMPGEST